jgi:RNA polymerase sigma-70 factor (ECF subfamily)
MEPRIDTKTRSVIEELYRGDGARMWRAIMLYTRDPEIASDAVAEAFAQALARGDALRTPDRWVWKVAFRVADGHLKDRGRRAGSEPPDIGVEASPFSLDLSRALARLSRRQRAAVVLHYLGGYSQREIAARIGSTTAAVGVHIHRARANLRKHLEDDDA